jgi:phospholipase D1/2
MGVRTPQPASLRPYGASSSVVRVHCHINGTHVMTYMARCALAEHLGLIPPLSATSRHEHVTSFMRPAPVPNDDETDLEEDACVSDPLSDGLLNLWNTTARVNREVFTELFRPVPSNLVQSWNAYGVSGR